MGESNLEIEIKYYVNQLAKIEACLVELGADQVQPRTHEFNLRFDTLTGELARQSKILRLRRDKTCYLTYKEGNTVTDGVSLRREIEFTVSNFDAARAFLESLGFQVCMIYEKYRAVYKLESTLVTLDEMPFGDFVEIEGSNGSIIQGISRKLGLNWDTRIWKSYTDLFQSVQLNLGLNMDNLTFNAFEDLVVSSSDLGVRPGDDA